MFISTFFYSKSFFFPCKIGKVRFHLPAIHGSSSLPSQPQTLHLKAHNLLHSQSVTFTAPFSFIFFFSLRSSQFVYTIH
ncbi:hypothetical protein L2E82_28581 [Cichorium intybus]|uniref:Uncharacterized protein n=1 Tax=Cichorium intybus TaxID=13427 RepID=A0ACB9CWE6_CICIN|nr:hypothetical protein L2E82_28581 [Cichorium intybus]